MNTGTFVFHLLHQAHQAAAKAFEDDLTPTQYVVLKTLYELGDGVNQSILIQRTGIDRSTMSDVLRRMVKLEFITRRRKQNDMRCVGVSMTKDGRDALHRATNAAERANDAILNAIPQSQQRTFLRHLESIARGPVKVAEAA